MAQTLNPFSDARKNQLLYLLRLIEIDYYDPHNYPEHEIYLTAKYFVQQYFTKRTEKSYKDAINYIYKFEDQSNYIPGDTSLSMNTTVPTTRMHRLGRLFSK